jgi:hypothetical protein
MTKNKERIIEKFILKQNYRPTNNSNRIDQIR